MMHHCHWRVRVCTAEELLDPMHSQPFRWPDVAAAPFGNWDAPAFSLVYCDASLHPQAASTASARPAPSCSSTTSRRRGPRSRSWRMPGAESMDWPEGTTLPLVCGGGVGYGRKGGTAVLHHRRYPLLIAAFYSFHNKLWNGVGRFYPKPCRGKCEVTLHCPSLAQQVRARPGRLPGAAQRDQAR